jgi:hypothetical protein
VSREALGGATDIRMKIPQTLGWFIVVLSCQVWAQGSQSSSTGQGSCVAAWKAYLENPSPVRGERLYALLPRSIEQAQDVDSTCREMLYSKIWSLQDRVNLQERIAVKIGFRMLSLSDGDFTESLDQILGSLIRRNPTMFLEELAIHRELVIRLDGLLGDFGYAFVDQPIKERRELGRRIASLRSVRKKALRALRDECIAELIRQEGSTP